MTQAYSLHIPVLLEEALQGLAIKTDGTYIDATFGRGGHSSALLARLGPAGHLLAFDQDPTAIAYGREHFQHEPRLQLKHASFTELATSAPKEVDGVLFDLGVSSPQLDDAKRGFSFLNDGPLDMRMNPEAGVSAAHWLNTAEESQLARVIWEFGEERFSRRIARHIVADRLNTPFSTTHQLAHCIAKAVPKREPNKHPATRSFQAIRIFLNNELQALHQGLGAALALLKSGGRLSVISFHSLEDRIVKQFMRREAQGDPLLWQLPLSDAQRCIRLKHVGKAIKPSPQEIAHNPRARSAILRIGERL